MPPTPPAGVIDLEAAGPGLAGSAATTTAGALSRRSPGWQDAAGSADAAEAAKDAEGEIRGGGGDGCEFWR